jgi:hypothetical protein
MMGATTGGDMDIIDYYGYRLTPVYRRIDTGLAQQIMDFWKGNRAIDDPIELKRRVAEVVYVALAPGGELIGISTVYIAYLDDKPYYFYRMFIQDNHRRAGMMRQITRATYDYLQQLPVENKPLGMIIVTENSKLMREGVRRMLVRHGCIYLGKTPRNLDMWKADFLSIQPNQHRGTDQSD